MPVILITGSGSVAKPRKTAIMIAPAAVTIWRRMQDENRALSDAEVAALIDGAVVFAEAGIAAIGAAPASAPQPAAS